MSDDIIIDEINQAFLRTSERRSYDEHINGKICRTRMTRFHFKAFQNMNSFIYFDQSELEIEQVIDAAENLICENASEFLSFRNLFFEKK